MSRGAALTLPAIGFLAVVGTLGCSNVGGPDPVPEASPAPASWTHPW